MDGLLASNSKSPDAVDLAAVSAELILLELTTT